MNCEEKTTLTNTHYIKLVAMDSVNPNKPLFDRSREAQVALLNRCLNDYPKGTFIGKDVIIGRYMVGEHELTMEKVIYHAGVLKILLFLRISQPF